MPEISSRRLVRRYITNITAFVSWVLVIVIIVYEAGDANVFAHGLSTTATKTTASAPVNRKQPTKPIEKEYFSVAPMMAHTNRHYRYFFRQMSENAHLYTEMLPASQIVQVYEKVTGTNCNENDPHQLQETVQKLIEKQDQLSLENMLDIKSYNLLQELLDGSRQHQKQPNYIALQLGGRDPETLAYAAAIATSFGYTSINLNCGCPSTTVASGRQAGAALMREPELVATCLEQMSHAMNEINPKAILSVKHRLGTADASTYSICQDSEELAYESCHRFLKLVSLAGNVSKVHVHARLALLGLADGETIEQATESERKDVALWSSYDNKNNKRVEDLTKRIKVDHKRAQYIAKRQARQATIQNRSIPPLRPTVVEQIANDFPKLEVVANGGVQSISQIQNRIFPNSQVTGVMVGRSAINHPCSFAGVDSILWNNNHSQKQTRKQVLQNYIQYCHTQEEQMTTAFPSRSEGELKEFRKKLIAAPFHLFMGEDGNNAYQRRLRKLVSRGDRHSSPSMLQAAMAQVPDSTLDKQVDDHIPWDEIETFDFTKRSGTMQRTIY